MRRFAYGNLIVKHRDSSSAALSQFPVFQLYNTRIIWPLLRGSMKPRRWRRGRFLDVVELLSQDLDKVIRTPKYRLTTLYKAFFYALTSTASFRLLTAKKSHPILYNWFNAFLKRKRKRKPKRKTMRKLNRKLNRKLKRKLRRKFRSKFKSRYLHKMARRGYFAYASIHNMRNRCKVRITKKRALLRLIAQLWNRRRSRTVSGKRYIIASLKRCIPKYDIQFVRALSKHKMHRDSDASLRSTDVSVVVSMYRSLLRSKSNVVVRNDGISRRRSRIGRTFRKFNSTLRMRYRTFRMLRRTSRERYRYTVKDLLDNRYSTARLQWAFIRVPDRILTGRRNLYYVCAKIWSTVNFLKYLVSRRSVIDSSIQLFFSRHVYCSIFSWFVHTTHKHAYSDLYPVVTRTSGRYILSSLSYNASMISFLYKLAYLRFISMFLSRFHKITPLLPDSFLMRAFAPSNTCNVLLTVLNKQSMLSYFFKFLSGSVHHTRFSARLLSVTSHLAHRNSLFIIYWILRHYVSSYVRVRAVKALRKCFTFMLVRLSSVVNRRMSRHYSFLFARIFNLCRSVSVYIGQLRSVTRHSMALFSYIYQVQLDNFVLSNTSIALLFQLYRLNRATINFTAFLSSIKYLTFQLEHSMFSYTKVSYFIFARYFYKVVPPIQDARFLCNYVLIKLSIGYKIGKIFQDIHTWQKYWRDIAANKARRLAHKYGSHVGQFIYQIKGIRIICSGPPYRARRTTAITYNMWVSDEYMTGRMPLSTMNLRIEYHQSYAIIRRSNIGIKVWLLYDEVVT